MVSAPGKNESMRLASSTQRSYLDLRERERERERVSMGEVHQRAAAAQYLVSDLEWLQEDHISAGKEEAKARVS